MIDPYLNLAEQMGYLASTTMNWLVRLDLRVVKTEGSIEDQH